MERAGITFSFENVIAWQKAHQFALLAYRATQQFSLPQFEELRKSLEETSMFLNSYCKGIINNNGVKEE